MNAAMMAVENVAAAVDSRFSDLSPLTLHTWTDLVWFLCQGHPKGSQSLSEINFQVAPFL